MMIAYVNYNKSKISKRILFLLVIELQRFVLDTSNVKFSY